MVLSGPALSPRFDPTDPALAIDPYPAYARLREASPVCRAGPAQLAVTRYDDVAALLRNPRLRSRIPDEYQAVNIGDGPARSFFQRIPIYHDPPSHTRLRRVMAKAFHPSLVRALEPRVAKLVDEMLDPVADHGALDAVSQLAFPLPVTVVCELVGIPASDRDLARPHAWDLGKAFVLNPSPADRAAADAAVAWLREYVRALAEERRRSPRHDLLSAMIAAEEDGCRLTDDEVVDNAVFLFFAGFETTMNMISTALAALTADASQLALLRADRSLAASACEEALRDDAPIQIRARYVVEPVEVAGRVVRPGRVLLLLIGSANHDERRFADPDRFDITRTPNPHLSFGGGAHLCLGAALARLEGRVLLDRLLDRFAVIEQAAASTRRTDGGYRSLASLPLAVRPA